MPRPKGARNTGFEARRALLAERLRARLADGVQPWPSFRDLAAAAGVGVTTLRHYFGDRAALVAAVLQAHSPAAEPHLRFLATPQAPFAASIEAAAAYVAVGLGQRVVADLHAVGLTEGLGRPVIGAAYLNDILEPMVLALEARLAAHMAAGAMRRVDPRHAALSLLAPILLTHLHQAQLGGRATRPLEEAAFLREHCAMFVRAYAAAPETSR